MSKFEIGEIIGRIFPATAVVMEFRSNNISCVFVHNNPEVEAKRSYMYALSLFCHSTQHAGNSFGLLSQGYCEGKAPNS